MLPFRMKNTVFTKNLLFKIAAILLLVLVSISTSKDGGDFDVFLDAARKLKNGQNIYAPPFVDGLQYYYSVFFALILIPISSNVFNAEVLWSLFSFFLLYRSFVLVKHYFDFSAMTKRQYNTWVILTVLLSLQFILYNVSLIQITVFLLWGILETIRLMDNKKPLLAGVLLGLIINIKIMPLLILPYLFYRGYFKTLIATLVTFVILLFLPALFIGNDFNQFLLSEWWHIINPSNKEHLFETGNGSHSVVALLPVYLTDTVGEMPYKRNFMNMSHQNVELVINLTRLFILGLSLLYFKAWPFKKETNKLKTFWEISFFMLIIPMLMPHQQKYAFLLAAPMIAYILYYFIVTFKQQKTKMYYLVFGLFCVSMLFYSPLYGSDIVGRFLFNYTQHFRFLSFATLFLFPISLYCSPGRLKQVQTV